MGRQVCRRDTPGQQAHRARDRLDGELWAEHERVSILRDVRSAPPRDVHHAALKRTRRAAAADCRYAKHPHLDNNYAVFGKVIDGWETLKCASGTRTRAPVVTYPMRPIARSTFRTRPCSTVERLPCNEKHRPLTPLQIDRITIHANPLAEQMIVFPTANGPPDIQT